MLIVCTFTRCIWHRHLRRASSYVRGEDCSHNPTVCYPQGYSRHCPIWCPQTRIRIQRFLSQFPSWTRDFGRQLQHRCHPTSHHRQFPRLHGNKPQLCLRLYRFQQPVVLYRICERKRVEGERERQTDIEREREWKGDREEKKIEREREKEMR